MIYFILFILIVVIFVFLPRFGLLAILRRQEELNMKIHIEDALKHIFDYNQKGLSTSFKSIEGSLGIRYGRLKKVIGEMLRLKLAELKGEVVNLTHNGEEYARKMIRLHRLWERYLADSTEISRSRIHKLAEKEEHLLTEDKLKEVSAHILNPRFDPHGDPIPTRSGLLPESKWDSLLEAAEGKIYRIIHIEDEPYEIFSKILKSGILLNERLKIIEKTPEKVLIETSKGKRVVLDYQMALNLSVIETDDLEHKVEKAITLADLEIGEEGIVKGISPLCKGLKRKRMLDLGIIRGTLIKVELRSPTGDPTAYRVKNSLIALRKSQAKMIEIERR
ncbi:MAG: FeoA domain-containing protein [Ignavibacteria bacterium]